MLNMAQTNVLVSGMDGLGVEIAKNLILGGFKSVNIHDVSVVSLMDLSTQYYFSQQDIGKKRTKCCIDSLSKLNSYVTVKDHDQSLTKDFFKNFSIVVLVNQPYLLLNECSNWARLYNTKLIIANTNGLLGQIFCDFGPTFKSIDPTGEEPNLLLISHITDDQYVTMLDSKRHGLLSGDYVSFALTKDCAKKLGKNYSPPFIIDVISSDSFHIRLPISNEYELDKTTCIKVNQPENFNFLPFSESLIKPKFISGNFSTIDNLPTFHLAFLALKFYQQKYLSFPFPHNLNDAEKFIEIAKELNNSGIILNVEKLDLDLLKLISMQSFGQIASIQSIIGGIVAQEVIKGSSNKYTPINQWFYYDALELINNDKWKNLDQSLFNINTIDFSEYNFRSMGQICVFGKEFQKVIEKSSVFVVGCGAIGCELLKNLSLMCVSTSSDKNTSTIYVTDMDTIERSNLSRQFLFRNNDIGKMKSETAAFAVKKINPYINIKCYQLKVGEENENIFNMKFYEKIDCILNALDNIDARRYMDRQAITHNISMLDGGTLGTLGNVQVIIPNLTESYSSSVDPEESLIPVCTLKHFPYLIEHTIQYALDLFHGLFKNIPQICNNFVFDKLYIENKFKLNNFEFSENIKNTYNYLIEERPLVYEDCLKWARNKFDEHFVNSIKQLLHTFPPDHLGNFGQPFWILPKKCPKSLNFDFENKTHFDFITSAANLLAYIYSIPIDKSKLEILKFYEPPEFQIDTSLVIHENQEMEEHRLKYGSNDSESESCNIKLDELKCIDEKKFSKLNPIDFEKDDDSNFHMKFISSCANLRAENYSIQNVDFFKAKLIAGKIIPALATTTSVVAGLQCLEFYKILFGFNKVDYYRNSYMNLNISLITGTEPFPPPLIQGVDSKFTLWDKIVVYEMNVDNTLMKIKDLINYIKDKYNLATVSMINYGKKLIYADFVKSANERLNTL